MKLSEIYQIVYDEIRPGEGICTTLQKLRRIGRITGNGYYYAVDALHVQRPKWYKHTLFWLHPSYNKDLYFRFWWDFRKDGNYDQRKKFLKMLVKKFQILGS